MKKIIFAPSIFFLSTSCVLLCTFNSFSQPATFNYTGVVQTYTVPACVSSVSLDVKGAEGAVSTSPSATVPGKGGRVQATIPVAAGEVLNIYVGQKSISNAGGWNGGGTGGTGGSDVGGGGGASDIRQGGNAFSNRVIIAGGGGGAGYDVSNGVAFFGGNGGGSGTAGNGGDANNGGKGGTQTAGGVGGTSGANGFPGSLGNGGNGGGPYGAGGGGGRYGGGGGGENTTFLYGGGGGGGSSYAIPAATGIIHTQGFQTGNGQIIITPIASTGPPAPGSIAGSNSVCAGSASYYSISAVTGAITYTWTVPSGAVINSGQGTTSITVTFGSASGNISVAAGNSCGTSPASTITVTVSPAPPANAGMDQTICSGQSATLSATGGTNYLWSTGETNASIMVTPVTTTIYTVLVSDAGGCSGTDEVSVTVNPNAMANAGADVSICNSDSTTLNGTGNGSYLWIPSTGLSDPAVSNPVASPASTTTYTLTVTNSCGSASDEVTVTITTTPSVDPGSDQTMCVGDTIQLNASGSGTFSWTPSTGLSCTNCPNPFAYPNATTAYTVTITTSCGTASDYVMITVDSCGVVGISSVVISNENILIIPNPTTGKFQVSSFKFQVEIIEIYNVMGEKVFTSPLTPLSNGRGEGGEVDFSSHPPGIYFLKAFPPDSYREAIGTENGMTIQKIIKQ